MSLFIINRRNVKKFYIKKIQIWSDIRTEHDFSALMFLIHPQQNVTKQLIKIVNGLHMV